MKISLWLATCSFPCLSGTLTAAVAILDDLDVGYSESGSFAAQVINNRYNSDWRYQNNSAGSDTATYAFTGLADGKYVASRASWIQGNLSSAAIYTLSNGAGTYTQDQRNGVNHFDTTTVGATDNVSFQRLSNFNGYTPFTVVGGTFTAVLSDSDSTAFLIADAIRLESVRSDVDKIYVIGNGDSGYSESSGTWATYNEAGDHGGNFRYSSGSTSDVITISFTGIDPGQYRISSAWTAGGNRSSNVTLGYNTVGSSSSLTYSQAPGAAANDVFENVNWQDMFSNVTVTGTALTLTLQNNSSGGGQLLIADGFRLEKLAVPEPSSTALAVAATGLVMSRRRRK